MQRATASNFCCSVNWRLVLVGLVIVGQSDGHGVTHRDLSTDSGEAQTPTQQRSDDPEPLMLAGSDWGGSSMPSLSCSAVNWSATAWTALDQHLIGEAGADQVDTDIDTYQQRRSTTPSIQDRASPLQADWQHQSQAEPAPCNHPPCSPHS